VIQVQDGSNGRVPDNLSNTGAGIKGGDERVTTYEAYKQLAKMFPGKEVLAQCECSSWWDKANQNAKPCRVYIPDMGLFEHGWSQEFGTFEEALIYVKEQLAKPKESVEESEPLIDK
jgi:hypothetical protein